MTVKMHALPFHWVFPFAPAKYRGCTVSIPFYDPDAPVRDNGFVRKVRVISVRAAVGSVSGKRFHACLLPKRIFLPTVVLNTTKMDRGRGWELQRVSLDHLGFRRFSVEDLATLPFSKCKGERVKAYLLKVLKRFDHEEA